MQHGLELYAAVYESNCFGAFDGTVRVEEDFAKGLKETRSPQVERGMVCGMGSHPVARGSVAQGILHFGTRVPELLGNGQTMKDVVFKKGPRLLLKGLHFMA